MDIQTNKKILDRVQAIAGLAQIALQDIYLTGYQDGIAYALRQLSAEENVADPSLEKTGKVYAVFEGTKILRMSRNKQELIDYIQSFPPDERKTMFIAEHEGGQHV